MLFNPPFLSTWFNVLRQSPDVLLEDLLATLENPGVVSGRLFDLPHSRVSHRAFQEFSSFRNIFLIGHIISDELYTKTLTKRQEPLIFVPIRILLSGKC